MSQTMSFKQSINVITSTSNKNRLFALMARTRIMKLF